MKKLLIVPIITALLAASSAWAGFGLPSVNTGNSTVNSAVNKGIDMGKNKAIGDAINNKLKKYHCSFPTDDALDVMTVKSCDLGKISGEIANMKGLLEGTGVVSKVKVNVNASHKKDSGKARTRAINVCNKIAESVNWWDCSESTGSGSNDFSVSVSVN